MSQLKHNSGLEMTLTYNYNIIRGYLSNLRLRRARELSAVYIKRKKTLNERTIRWIIASSGMT